MKLATLIMGCLCALIASSSAQSPQQVEMLSVAKCHAIAGKVRYAAVLRDAGYPREKAETEVNEPGETTDMKAIGEQAVELAYVFGQGLTAMNLYTIAIDTCMARVPSVRRVVPGQNNPNSV